MAIEADAADGELLGHVFADKTLLTEALTTPSYRMDHPDAQDNQRLEFLGDAVIGLLAAERLYAERPDDSEGVLTVKRTHMVSTVALCEAALRHGLATRLLRNRCAEPLPEGSKTLADAVEAVIGAAYVDGGYAAAKKVFDSLELDPDAPGEKWNGNPKGELQIRAQAMTPPRHPEYTIVSSSGKAHNPVFTVKVFVDGMGEAVASAGSHKAAEALAAAKLLSSDGLLT